MGFAIQLSHELSTGAGTRGAKTQAQDVFARPALGVAGWTCTHRCGGSLQVIMELEKFCCLVMSQYECHHNKITHVWGAAGVHRPVVWPPA